MGAHSSDEGLSPTTVFWAVRVPNGAAHVDLNRGTASLHVERACVFDAFTVGNSIARVNRSTERILTTHTGKLFMPDAGNPGMGPPPTPPDRVEYEINEPVNRMRGTFGEGTATIEVTATTPRTMVTGLSNDHGFRFVSDPASTSVNHFALIGRERNGVW